MPRNVKLLPILVLALILCITPTSALRNPSMVFCEDLGFEYTIISTDKGEVGGCILPDERIVEAWAFLKGKIASEYHYCTKMGYGLETVEDCSTCDPIFTCECAVCILPDGSRKEATTLMALDISEFEEVETVCGDGNCTPPENHSTCPADCPSGGGDIFCDEIADGICDPDCQPDRDPDCPLPQEDVTKDVNGFIFATGIIALFLAAWGLRR